MQELGTECGKRGEWGNLIFRGMLTNILCNVAELSGNVPEDSGESNCDLFRKILLVFCQILLLHCSVSRNFGKSFKTAIFQYTSEWKILNTDYSAEVYSEPSRKSKMKLFSLVKNLAKRPPSASFSPVTSTNSSISPQNFLTFSLNPFSTLV